MAAAKKKLENMTEEELDQEHVEVMEQKDAWREHAAEVQAEKDRRAIKKKVEGLTDDEKAEMVQIIQAEGIESEEAVNGE